MQQYLIMCLCIFTTLFISTEARYCGHNSGYDNSGYSNSGYSNSAYSSSGYNSNGNGGGGLGRSGYGNSGYGNSGYGNSGYGSSGHRSSGHGSSRLVTSRGNNNMDYSAYVPGSCPGCKINNLGNGDYNTHTFNLPKGIFD